MTKQYYIGDGVYMLDDGYHIVLSTERAANKHYIYLDRDCLVALWRMIEKTRGVTITVQSEATDGA